MRQKKRWARRIARGSRRQIFTDKGRIAGWHVDAALELIDGTRWWRLPSPDGSVTKEQGDTLSGRTRRAESVPSIETVEQATLG